MQVLAGAVSNKRFVFRIGVRIINGLSLLEISANCLLKNEVNW